MEKEGENILLIDLNCSPINRNSQVLPLIPPPACENSRISFDNNPFDILAKKTNYDPFELLEAACNGKTEQDLNIDLETRYDLVKLNDSNKSTASNKSDHTNESSIKNAVCIKNNLASSSVSSNKSVACNESYLGSSKEPNDKNLVIIKSDHVASNECNSKNTVLSKTHLSNFGDFTGNSSVISPISLPYSDKLSPAITSHRYSNSFSCISGGNTTDLSKKSNISENLSNISSVKCELIENSNDVSDQLSVFLEENEIPSNENLKDYVTARIQSCIKKTLSKSFAGFDKTGDQNSLKKSGSAVPSFSTNSRNLDGSTSLSIDLNTESDGMFNKAFLTVDSINASSDKKQEISSGLLKTSTPTCKNKINGSYFESTPVEILKEAKRLSQYISRSSTNHDDIIDHSEDLLSLKPIWPALDSSSDEENSLDDSFKSLKVNFQRTSITTPTKTPESAALKNFRKLRFGPSSCSSSPSEKKTAVKVRSHSADRVVSDSPLRPIQNKACPVKLHPAVLPTKLENVKPWSKNTATEVKMKGGPMKALVPLKNMLKIKGPSSPANVQNCSTKSVSAKKSASKPAASSTPKRFRKPLAENNAQEFSSPSNKQKLRRSNSYENKTPESSSKIPSRSSSLTSVGIKPPTPVHKLPQSVRSSPSKVKDRYISSPIKKVSIPIFKSRYSYNSEKENCY